MRTEFAKLLKLLRKSMPGLNLELIRHAYRVADRAHRGQLRLSGEPYVSHSLAVARILSGLKLDSTTIAAGLLHDVVEDTSVGRFEIESEFGPEIALLVDGVTKISTLYSYSSDQQQVEKQAASIRKMLVATAKDVRVLLIKLADRLHNMRTIEYLPPDRIRHISQETLNIYAPLAHRLGIARWKWELEDHAFHRLNPVEYKNMAALVTMKRREREAWLDRITKYLEERLREAQIKAVVIGRPKHLYSIYRKMMTQGKTFDEVMDVQAVRIITHSEADCYSALGVIHLLWKPLPGRFKDYIPIPKANGYQSIHTTVMTEEGRPLEIQIRTQEMDETAQYGIAAHWLYKEGDESFDEGLEERLKWLRQMYEWLQETHSADEFMDEIIRGVQMAEIFVFTPKGDVKELPAGATPLDFAYAIHSDVGHRCIGARVNGRLVPLSYNLQTGDRVEIMTSKNQTPHIGWINMVVTAKARTKIRQRLRELGALEPIDQKPKTPGPVQPRPPLQPYKPQVRVVDDATRNKLIRVQGVKNMAVQFAKCCNPMPGHAITGYITKAPGLSIHRVDCRLFARTAHDPKRVVRANWEGERQLQVGMQVKMAPRPNILADINEAIRPIVIDIINANYQAGSNGESSLDFIFNTTEQSRVEQVSRTIRCVVGVRSITTLFIRDLQDVPHVS
jgi:GTP pyrophosphokinase